MDLVIKVLINAAAVWVAVQLVPQITFDFGSGEVQTIQLMIAFGL